MIKHLTIVLHTKQGGEKFEDPKRVITSHKSRGKKYNSKKMNKKKNYTEN